MLKFYQLKTHCKVNSPSSKTVNIILTRLLTKQVKKFSNSVNYPCTLHKLILWLFACDNGTSACMYM